MRQNANVNRSSTGRPTRGTKSIIYGIQAAREKARNSDSESSHTFGSPTSNKSGKLLTSSIFGGLPPETSAKIENSKYLGSVAAGLAAMEVQQKSYAELLRIRCKAFFAYSLFGMVYDWVLLILSIISALLFISSTYLPVDGAGMERHEDTEYYLNIVELALSGIFSVDFALSLFVADHRFEFLGRWVLSSCPLPLTGWC